jgi:NAD(P)-dependent dehydrogenase (short-subunit alcohol dehydrogenase family)
MKIIIVGATGTIGKKVTDELAKRHEVIKVGNSKGEINVDILSGTSIEKMYKSVGSFDALVSTTGSGHFGPLSDMTIENFKVGLNSKLLGQISLVLIGQKFIKPKGSFTLTSGILSEDPVVYGANLSAVNGGVNGFVVGAAIELQNGVRINAISPGVVEDSPGYFPYFQGHIPVKMDRVIAAYVKSVEGSLTGQVIKVF